MKKILPIALMFGILLSCCGKMKKEPGKAGNNSKIKFESIVYDFGKIAPGSDGTCVFRFENTSREVLLINTVKTSCGCTNPEWPKDPIEQGKTGEIKVKYNTQIQGVFQKSITVFCNAENSPVKLIIKGEVQADPAVASSSSKK